MDFRRREFLKLAGTFASGMALTSVVGQVKPGTTSRLSGKNNIFGLQLYSLRDDLPKDPKGVLKQVASFGYKQLEGYEGPQGLFWGMSNTDFKKLMDDLGMKFVASHCDINKDFERKA